MHRFRYPLFLAVSAVWATTASAQIVNFTTWTLLEDPPHAQFNGTVDNPGQATLSAALGQTAIPIGTDIGFASINGPTAAGSTAGHAFDPAGNFRVSVDYDLSFGTGVSGGLALGFGIGEDTDGMNSAGVVVGTFFGSPVLSFTAVGRINDAGIPSADLGSAGVLLGRLIVEYDAATGDIRLFSDAGADGSIEGAAVFPGLQNAWSDALIFPSFFIRSDVLAFNGSADAVFTHFQVLEGTPIDLGGSQDTQVPEPGTAGLALLGVAALAAARRRMSRA